MPSVWGLIKDILRKIRWVLAALFLTAMGSIILFRYSVFPEPWSSFIREFGVALIIAGTVSLVYELFLRLSLAQTILELVEFPKPLMEAGLKSVNKRDITSISLKFLQSVNPKRVRLLGITTDYYFKGGPGAELYDEIEKYLKKGCEVQLLMLNPDSPHVTFREEEEKKTDAYITETLREKLIRIFNERFLLQKKYPNLKIKLYKTSPLCSITILDDRVLKITPYLYQVLGLKSPTFEIENKETDACIFNAYQEHFDNIWKDAEERSEPFGRTPR